ncbi:MAG TPA: PEGA domain-containing protein [Phycisphaerae bacterium]
MNTEPQGALVYLNDEEIGRSPASTDFTWYGDYDVIVRKEGFQTVRTHAKVNPPWYQLIPFDFLSEVLWPGWIHDQRSLSYSLAPATQPSREELLEDAKTLRERAVSETKHP